MPNKKLPIDGPAGRNEVSDEYRDNYDRIFKKVVTLYYHGVKMFETRPDGSMKQFPKKSRRGGGKNAR
jgi:hypothetical protein